MTVVDLINLHWNQIGGFAVFLVIMWVFFK